MISPRHSELDRASDTTDRSATRASTHVFAIDLIDEGFGHLLDEARGRGSLHGVVFAASYHDAFDIFPHNPIHRVYAHEAGALHFRFDASRYEGMAIQPTLSSLAARQDPLALLVEEAARRGMAVRAWTNHLQATDQGRRHPECVVRNAFGDPYPRWLCVANPDVRAYVRAVSGDLARYPIETILLESLCFQPFDLVFLHGRSHFAYPPTVQFLLSLCFCVHCVAAARAAGVAVDTLLASLREVLASSLSGQRTDLDDVPLEHDAVGTLFGGEMRPFLDVRQSIVTSLIAEVTQAVRDERSACRVVVMDWSGGLGSYRSGEAEGGLSCERAWQDGVDLADVAASCDGLCVLGYSRDLDRLRRDVHAYRTLIGMDRSLSIALRPMAPDCRSPQDLAERLSVVQSVDPDWVEFYHYGLMRRENLDWIAAALESTADSPSERRLGGGLRESDA